MVLATLFASFANMQNLTNKKNTSNSSQSFQLQLVINNRTSEINGASNIWIFPNPNSFKGYFYLDNLNINGTTYNDDDFINYAIKTTNNDFHFQNRDGDYNDIFWTTPNKETTLITLSYNIIPSINTMWWSFIFGIYVGGFHYQNTAANNYQYNFRD